MKKALICGISGQDGVYLAQLLAGKGYAVFGTSRMQNLRFDNLTRLGLRDRVQIESMDLRDLRRVSEVLLKILPDEVYHLAGQSSVGLSFESPVETIESVTIGTLNLLEAIRSSARPIKFFNAGSSECFGDTGGIPANEMTPFRPRSPYAVAKCSAFWQTANYREAYGLFACSGILFNHESPLRSNGFVTKKIVTAACRIGSGSTEKLRLGNIGIKRDWGWAPEYVEAMWLMLQQKKPDDFVIASGQTRSLQDFIEVSFSRLGLDWREFVVVDPMLLRPTDIPSVYADTGKAHNVLGWSARYKMNDVARMMVDAERADVNNDAKSAQ